MKQRITFEQWEEVDRLDRIKFFADGTPKLCKCKKIGINFSYQLDFRPNIGQMIAFLGEDFLNMSLSEVEGNERVWFVHIDGFRTAGEDELCDALWAVVKEKLNSTSKSED